MSSVSHPIEGHSLPVSFQFEISKRRDQFGAPPRILTVHAHPDDESSKGAPTIAKYAAAGVFSTLVCATGGEAGDILNPRMDRPEVKDNIKAVREQELTTAASIIGYGTVEMLGYHDSGMPDTEENARPDNFWNAHLNDAIERLVRIIRRDRPQVIITYGDDQRHYAHPDHLRVHDISVPAFQRAGDRHWYPEAGEPWQPSKLYYTVWSRRRMLLLHEKFIELGLESPFGDEWLERMRNAEVDERATTTIDIAGYYWVREDALKAHATQIDPDDKFWFGLPTAVAESVHPVDDYVLAKSNIVVPEIIEGTPETDLFAGIDGLEGVVNDTVARLDANGQ